MSWLEEPRKWEVQEWIWLQAVHGDASHVIVTFVIIVSIIILALFPSKK